MAQTLQEFTLGLLNDEQTRSLFAADPAGVLQSAGLGDITAADVHEILPLVLDMAPTHVVEAFEQSLSGVVPGLPSLPGTEGAISTLQELAQHLTAAVPALPVDGLSSLPGVGTLTSALPVDGLTSALPVDGLSNLPGVDTLTSALPVDGLTSALPLDGLTSAVPGLDALPLNDVTGAVPALDGLTSAVPGLDSLPLNDVTSALPGLDEGRSLTGALPGLDTVTSAIPALPGLPVAGAGLPTLPNLPLDSLTSAVPAVPGLDAVTGAVSDPTALVDEVRSAVTNPARALDQVQQLASQVPVVATNGLPAVPTVENLVGTVTTAASSVDVTKALDSTTHTVAGVAGNVPVAGQAVADVTGHVTGAVHSVDVDGVTKTVVGTTTHITDLTKIANDPIHSVTSIANDPIHAVTSIANVSHTLDSVTNVATSVHGDQAVSHVVGCVDATVKDLNIGNDNHVGIGNVDLGGVHVGDVTHNLDVNHLGF